MKFLSAVCILLGSFLMLVGSFGMVRMPDLLIRMHSSTKAGTIGIGLIFLSVALHFQRVDITTRVIAAVVFLFLTVPLGIQIIARAAHALGVRYWEGTFVDELREDSGATGGESGVESEADD